MDLVIAPLDKDAVHTIDDLVHSIGERLDAFQKELADDIDHAVAEAAGSEDGEGVDQAELGMGMLDRQYSQDAGDFSEVCTHPLKRGGGWGKRLWKEMIKGIACCMHAGGVAVCLDLD